MICDYIKFTNKTGDGGYILHKDTVKDLLDEGLDIDAIMDECLNGGKNNAQHPDNDNYLLHKADQRRAAMQIPQGGRPIAAQQQIALTESDTTIVECECGHGLFEIAYQMRTLSHLSPKNPTGKDMPIKIEVYVCRACGAVLGVT